MKFIRSQENIGFIFAILAYFLFSILDVFQKYGTIYHTVFQIMKKKNNGYIINISSIAGKIPINNSSVYCGTKFGLHGFGSALNKELKDNGIKVSTIFPGGINTPLWKKTKYKPGNLKQALHPKDVFKIVDIILKLGRNTNFNEAVLTPTIENF